jgi:hypothetical protein
VPVRAVFPAYERGTAGVQLLLITQGTADSDLAGRRCRLVPGSDGVTEV